MIVMYTRGSSKENVLVLVIGRKDRAVLGREWIAEKNRSRGEERGRCWVKTIKQIWRKIASVYRSRG